MPALGCLPVPPPRRQSRLKETPRHDPHRRTPCARRPPTAPARDAGTPTPPTTTRTSTPTAAVGCGPARAGAAPAGRAHRRRRGERPWWRHCATPLSSPPESPERRARCQTPAGLARSRRRRRASGGHAQRMSGRSLSRVPPRASCPPLAAVADPIVRGERAPRSDGDLGHPARSGEHGRAHLAERVRDAYQRRWTTPTSPCSTRRRPSP